MSTKTLDDQSLSGSLRYREFAASTPTPLELTVRGIEAVVFRHGQYLPSEVDTLHCLQGDVLQRGAQVQLREGECLIERVHGWKFRTTDHRGFEYAVAGRPVIPGRRR